MSASALIRYHRSHECTTPRWDECHDCVAYENSPREARDDCRMLEFRGKAMREREPGHVSRLSWRRIRAEAERLYLILVHGFGSKQETWSPQSGGPTALLRVLYFDVEHSETRDRGMKVRCVISHIGNDGYYLATDRWLSPWMEVSSPWEVDQVDETHVLRGMLARILNESV